MAKPRHLKEVILALRDKGKSYNEIVEIVGCSKSTVAYYCNQTTKDKSIEQTAKLIKDYPFYKKMYRYMEGNRRKYHIRSGNIKPSEVLNKFGENPKCYLTGEQIDWTQTDTYSFDHRIPVSKGGQSTLDNMEVCSIYANRSKTDLLPDEYIDLCKKVLTHHGYDITLVL